MIGEYGLRALSGPGHERINRMLKMTVSKLTTVKEKLTEALLSDGVTPSAATRISEMLEEVAHEPIGEERIDVLHRELDDIMANLSGPTVDEIKDKVAKGELGLIAMLKMWFRSKRGS
jgi:iron uptake system EfeUOB component EfeO/EfeM